MLLLADKHENLLSGGQICKHILDNENSEDISTSIRDLGQRVRSWWWSIKATQEGDHVNAITQFTYELIWNFRSLGLNTAKITDYIKKLFK